VKIRNDVVSVFMHLFESLWSGVVGLKTSSDEGKTTSFLWSGTTSFGEAGACPLGDAETASFQGVVMCAPG
jgi:hypothetical protein